MLSLFEKSGSETHSLDADTLRDAATHAQNIAEEAGIVEAPAYVIENQLFIGREHLPWIEEIILRAKEDA